MSARSRNAELQVADLMVPLASYTTIDQEATLAEAFRVLGAALAG